MQTLNRVTFLPKAAVVSVLSEITFPFCFPRGMQAVLGQSGKNAAWHHVGLRIWREPWDCDLLPEIGNGADTK
jgi:hypothetical protein